ncbi:serine hydrolase [Caulobacter sp. SLTY]|uniref:serine hydrolase domain-containing protein n=1 Tax=Caulobacter sp. SLTY TaxID=2683262 RepID=UPI0014125A59|nr:serine hydrolase [Caulobacter sp. SLTY]NBB15164.1 serine hydrolase [Caulobacter sp. SLTY]
MIGRVLAVLALVLASGSQALAAGPAAVCAEAQAYSTARNGVSVLVLKNGAAVCEGYAGAGGPDRGWEIWSGTKSFNGMILAAAVQDGLITLDEKVADTLPEWRDDPRKTKVTIRQLLSLTSGIETTVGRAPDYAGAVAAAVTAEPGTRFDYGAEPFQVFGAVMNRKLKAAGTGDADVLAYLKRRILDPAGVRWTNWRRTPSGDALLPQGAVFTAREWAKFGEFVRGGAVRDGRPLVDPVAFQAQFEGTGVNPAYGLTWWLARPGGFGPRTAPVDFTDGSATLPADLRMAAGAGKQRLYILPSCGLTVVRQAMFNLRDARGGGPQWSDHAFLAPIIKAWC